MVFAVNPTASKTFAQFQVSPLSVPLDIFETMVFYRPMPWVVARAPLPLLVGTQVLALLAHPLAAHPLAVVRRLPPLKAVVPSELVAVPLVS